MLSSSGSSRVRIVLGSEIDLGLHVQAVDRLHASRERLQGGGETEVVQRCGPELGDEVAQAVDLLAEPLEHGVHGAAEGLAGRSSIGIEVARVGELQAQRAESLHGLVVDLPRPARALALTRLHAVAQPLDLDRALRLQALGDARRERAQSLAVGTSEARVPAQRDHETSALTFHAERLDEQRARLDPQFVQQRRVLPAGTIHRHRLALAVERTQRAAFDRHNAQPRAALAAGGGNAQLATLLDHHQQRARVEQREAAIGHQTQQPQLGSGEHSAGLWTMGRRVRALGSRTLTSRPPRPVAFSLRRRAGLGEQLLAIELLAPRGEPDRHAQRTPDTVGLDLDRAQAVEHASGDDLTAGAVRAGQHNEQLGVAGAPDPIEAPQLAQERRSGIGERLFGQLASMARGEIRRGRRWPRAGS